MANRTIRQAPEQEEFDARDIPVTRLGGAEPAAWYRLYRKRYQDQFFPSPGSRLTPAGGMFPCVYLASSRQTCVAEVWGDRLAAHRACGGTIYTISLAQARGWAYLRVCGLSGDLKLCDLAGAATRLATGLDAGTLYAADFARPQAWAERIARHPAGFDGIRYRSRHTDEICLVLWDRQEERPVSGLLAFHEDGEFAGSREAHELAANIGIRLSFAW